MDDAIVEEVRTAWTRLAQVHSSVFTGLGLPRAEDLKPLLEVVFLASLEREEGRGIPLRLAFLSSEVTDTGVHRVGLGRWLRFENPLPLTVENLKKIGPAFDQEVTTLAVVPEPKGLLLVGGILHGRASRPFEMGQSVAAPPQALTLTTYRPASVIVSHGDYVVGSLQKGTFEQADPGPMASQLFVGYMLEMLRSHALSLRFGNTYWLAYRDALTRTYSELAVRGHGGTVVLLANAERQHGESLVRRGIRVPGAPTGTEWIGELLAAALRTDNVDSVHLRAIANGRILDHLNMLAQLASVDGALILDEDLRPLRFGAQLEADEAVDRSIVRGPVLASDPPIPFDVSRLGLRHQSALRFANACPGSPVFVASEDGPVRAILRHGENLYVWPDCRNTFFLRNR